MVNVKSDISGLKDAEIHKAGDDIKGALTGHLLQSSN